LNARRIDIKNADDEAIFFLEGSVQFAFDSN